jgi:hypothetical protein
LTVIALPTAAEVKPLPVRTADPEVMETLSQRSMSPTAPNCWPKPT